MKEGDRVIIIKSKNYKGRTGTITDEPTILEKWNEQKQKFEDVKIYRVRLDNFNGHCLFFKESEIKK
ncbi:MAG: hypothetical protein FH753_00885 [Firmicutes bacterium]|nr:hypothetical protein [Bacillota bacterium]